MGLEQPEVPGYHIKQHGSGPGIAQLPDLLPVPQQSSAAVGAGCQGGKMPLDNARNGFSCEVLMYKHGEKQCLSLFFAPRAVFVGGL